MTHNVFFHKEVTFDQRRRDRARHFEGFWTIRKTNLGSTLMRHPGNPIRTSYELLWEELRQPNPATVQNVMRRILETYFKFFGNIDYSELSKEFAGERQSVFWSLVSWVNEGSHYPGEDLFVLPDDAKMDLYMSVFRAVFEESGHIQHYNMMMKVPDASVIEGAPAEQ